VSSPPCYEQPKQKSSFRTGLIKAFRHRFLYGQNAQEASVLATGVVVRDFRTSVNQPIGVQGITAPAMWVEVIETLIA
jgi:hypothetical protein